MRHDDAAYADADIGLIWARPRWRPLAAILAIRVSLRGDIALARRGDCRIPRCADIELPPLHATHASPAESAEFRAGAIIYIGQHEPFSRRLRATPRLSGHFAGIRVTSMMRYGISRL